MQSFNVISKKIKKSLMVLTIPFLLTGCSKDYEMNEKTFFLVMTNIQHYPEDYIDKDITFDSFTYKLTSTVGDEYLCVVRKCSSGYGCKCGKDTVIGFVVDKDRGLPEPKNQYEDTNDKAWVHIIGQIKNTDLTKFEIYNDNNEPETVQFLYLEIKDFSIIEDYSDLHYYVDK